ncbi:MAG: protein kinase [Deltaproteobacteria bacterium]|nr:protein kinase [Deltaproteobacteria bacterium]
MGTPREDFPPTGRFLMIRRLGSGGMGVVYEALDRETRTHVALKTIKAPSPDLVVRLKREFRALQGLQHPNLINLGELFEEEGAWFFTMELVRGVDFLTHVRPGVAPSCELALADTVDVQSGEWLSRGLDEARLRKALAQLATGLRVLHGSGKVHRDIKPSNVMVTDEGRVVILDFGLVTDAQAPGESAESWVGTAAYMAPEQAAGGRVGPEADWYSVGVVLYEALVGRPPFTGPSLRVLMQKQDVLPPAPSTLASVPRDLDKLCMELLRVNPEERPSGLSILSALGVSKSPRELTSSLTQAPPFVGRAEELAFLREAFEEVRQGKQVMVHVHGESGLGKTTLVRHFTDVIAGETSAVVLSGRCYERETVPFKAMDGVVDALGRYMERLPREQSAFLVPRRAGLLPQVFPALGKVRVLAGEPRIEIAEPREHRGQVFAALRELFCRLADMHPTIVVIDDLQWADADSWALLAELVRPPDAPTLLLVTTWRETGGGSDAHVRKLIDGLPGNNRQLVLEPLAASDARQLASVLLEDALGGQDGARRADAIAQEAAGHPLFIGELARQSVHAGGEDRIRFEDSVLARVARLEARAQKLLRLVVVAGEPILQATVARAAGFEIGLVMRELSGLCGMNLVRTAGRGDSRMVEPYHDRIRKAVMGSLPDEMLRACHLDLARVLEARGDANSERLALHYWGAGEEALAARYLEEAAHRSSQSLAFDHAARLYRLVLDLRLSGTSSERDLRVRLGNALANAGRGAEAAEELIRAADGAEAAEALELRRLAAQQYLVAGYIDQGLATLREVLSAVGMSYPSTPLRALASVAWRRLRLALGRRARFEERDASVIPGKDLARIDACYHVGLNLSAVDHVRGNAFSTLGLLYALKAGEPYRVARALAVESGYQAGRGGPKMAHALDLLSRAEAIAEKSPEPDLPVLVKAVRGQAAFLWGRFREALESCQEAEALFVNRCVGVPREVATMRLWSTRSLQYLGEVGELSRRLPQLVSESQSRDDRYGETSLRVSGAPFLCLAQDNPQKAKEEIAEALVKWSPQGFHVQHYYALTGHVSAELYGGEIDEAHRTLRERWPALRRSLLLRVQMVRILMNDLRARVALAASLRNGGDKQALLRESSRAAAQIEAENMPWARPLAVLLRAGVLAARGEPGGSLVALLGDALQGFQASDMGLHAACVRYWLGKVTGGDEGHALEGSARSWMEAQCIKNPERMAILLAPALALQG